MFDRVDGPLHSKIDRKLKKWRDAHKLETLEVRAANIKYARWKSFICVRINEWLSRRDRYVVFTFLRTKVTYKL